MLAVNVGNKFKSLAIHSMQVISGIKVEARLATLSYISKEKRYPFRIPSTVKWKPLPNSTCGLQYCTPLTPVNTPPFQYE